MCAIFGALLWNITDRRDQDIVNRNIADIVIKSHKRGRDGRGFDVYGNGGEFTRTVKSCNKGVIEKEFTTNFDSAFIEGLPNYAVLIGNTRAEPTTEYVKDKSVVDQQPYTLRNWSIVHNGTIANDKELRTNKYPSPIDSAAIVELFQNEIWDTNCSIFTFRDTVRKLKGSYAILATNKLDNVMFVAANYRPIWYIKTEFGVYFASSKDYFEGIENIVPKMVEPYTVMKFTYADWTGLQIQSLTLYETNRNKRALVVCSGGLDSTVAAKFLQYKGMEVKLIHFLYGSRAQPPEIDAILKIADALSVPVKIMDVSRVYDEESSPLLQKTSQIAKGEQGAEFAHEWVPARNLVLLSVAVAYAEANNFDYIALGNNLEEAGAYPDNEPEFINKLNEVLPFAVKAGKRLEILMPVGNLMKHEIVKMGVDIKAPLHLTWSCYNSGKRHCGKCGPCFMRRTAFQINGIPEVIKYEDEV